MLARFDGHEVEEHEGGAFVCTTHVEDIFRNEIARIDELIEAESSELTSQILNGQVSALKKVWIQMFGEEHLL